MINRIKKSLCVTLLASALISSSYRIARCEIKPLTKVPEKICYNTNLEKKIEDPNKIFEVNSNLIKKNIEEFVNSYVEESRKSQESLQKSIKKFGIKHVREVYSSVRFSSLKLAEEIVKSPEDPNQRELNSEYKKIASDFVKSLDDISVSVPIDYSNPKIVEGYERWVGLKTKFFRDLLCSDVKAEDYKGLVSETFTRKEYEKKFMLEQLKSVNAIYDALIGARTGVKGSFAKKPLNKARKFALEFYDDTDNIYGKPDINQPKDTNQTEK